ncbi:MAG: GNAT family N-acetyltransferase [Bacteroidales bacterium]|nr:GNAT family N-acetyltransferase [Bacteroidales bacterium]
MSYKTLTLKDSEEWNNQLTKLPVEQQDIYYTPEYYSLYENYGDGKAMCFVFEKDGDIALYPFLINSVNALGYELDKEYFDIQGAYGYNGVLTNTYNCTFIDNFYKSFYNYCQPNNIIAEFTRFHPLLENQKFSINHMQVLFDRETISIDLTKNYDEIWKNDYSSRNRNMIRKAEKQGYTCKIISKPLKTEIDNFISIYLNNMEMVGAEEYYYFNNDFFHNTFVQLKNQVMLFNIEDNKGQVVCSTIFFHYCDFFHYYLSGRTVDADNSVNNFLLNEAVKYSQGLGAKIFYLGGGRSCATDDSLLKFKSNFSKTRLPFYIGKKIYNEEIYNEVISQWQTKYPEKVEKYKNHLLKYRY